jgi:N6-L-threonylcarbamoyladenine synthase
MIAWASMHRFVAGDTDGYGILIRPKWSIEDLMGDEIDETSSYDIAK